jgi:phospholipase/carboxylesterase
MSRKQDRSGLSRREFLGAGAAVIAAACSTGRADDGGATLGDGRLKARPAAPTAAAAIGANPLGLGGNRDGILHVPSGYTPDTPAPLVLMLHGAGGSARGGIRPFQSLADASGLILLALDSRDVTWDAIRGDFGPDVAFIDRALAEVFRRCAVDPQRVIVEGFSDGATYALSLGLTNGDLFKRIVAFSPGFIAASSFVGKPQVYISHGTADTILPIDSCSRRIVPQLEGRGYDVRYHEFEGGHQVPAEIAQEAAGWLVA